MLKSSSIVLHLFTCLFIYLLTQGLSLNLELSNSVRPLTAPQYWDYGCSMLGLGFSMDAEDLISDPSACVAHTFLTSPNPLLFFINLNL